MLCLSISPGKPVTLYTSDGQITINTRERGEIRLAIDAPKLVRVVRADAIKTERREAGEP